MTQGIADDASNKENASDEPSFSLGMTQIVVEELSNQGFEFSRKAEIKLLFLSAIPTHKNCEGFACEVFKYSNHTKTDEIASSVIKKVKISWSTKSNVVDYAVFVMRHMEKFVGVHELFNTGLSNPGMKK
ncbi:hypothetical protein E3N88_04313 [Mikania micrantha]|uniref:Uncharacterized protein n=1 Tax=Mikania micrantha TaxID=192012 RepID=A0A5N6PU48_9ASTR|nr:hypothetical protein E3N88_04313 [Mikania micrantha]